MLRNFSVFDAIFYTYSGFLELRLHYYLKKSSTLTPKNVTSFMDEFLFILRLKKSFSLSRNDRKSSFWHWPSTQINFAIVLFCQNLFSKFNNNNNTIQQQLIIALLLRLQKNVHFYVFLKYFLRSEKKLIMFFFQFLYYDTF